MNQGYNEWARQRYTSREWSYWKLAKIARERTLNLAYARDAIVVLNSVKHLGYDDWALESPGRWTGRVSSDDFNGCLDRRAAATGQSAGERFSLSPSDARKLAIDYWDKNAATN